MALTNSRFVGEPDLEDCLGGKKTLTKGSQGPAVKKVQQALIDLNDPKIKLPVFGADGKYGDETAAAVFQFKSDRGLRNAGGFIDGIVGPKTMDALDKSVFPGSGGQPKPPTPPSPPTVDKFADVVVRILNPGGGGGQAAGELKNAGVFFTAKYKALNRDLFVLQFNGSVANSPAAAIVRRVDEIMKGRRRGAVCIFGGSVAGKNVLEVAKRLNDEKGIPRAYLGISDGAFFDADAQPPGGLFGVPIPVITLPAAFADRRVNVFQSFGNDTKFSGRLGRRIWFGKDPREPVGEIHGSIPGWENNNLTTDGNIKGPDPASAHNTAVGQGNASHEINITAILEKQPKS